MTVEIPCPIPIDFELLLTSDPMLTLAHRIEGHLGWIVLSVLLAGCLLPC